MKEKANILHIYNAYLAQSENWSYFQIKSLSNAYDIHIGSVHKVENDFDLRRFKTYYYPWGSQIKEYWELSNSNVFNIIKKLRIWIRTNITHTPYRYFNSILSRNNIQLIHFHFADVSWKYMQIAIKNRIPFCVSFYGWDYEKLPHTKPVYKTRFKQIFESASKIIVEGAHGKKVLIKHGCPKEKIEIIKLGVPKSSVQLKPIEKEKGELKLIQVSALKEKKGVLNTLKAYSEARKVCPNIHLTIGGDSHDEAYKKKIHQLVDQLNLNKHVKLIGHVNLNELNNVISKHQVFIHPSQYASDMDSEGGAPIVILNAQACGLPVISTIHCDIPDEVIDNSTGLLVNENSVDELKEAIIKFYKMDKTTFKEFSLRAVKHVLEEYDISENAKKLSSLYQQLLN